LWKPIALAEEEKKSIVIKSIGTRSDPQNELLAWLKIKIIRRSSGRALEQFEKKKGGTVWNLKDDIKRVEGRRSCHCSPLSSRK